MNKQKRKDNDCVGHGYSNNLFVFVYRSFKQCLYLQNSIFPVIYF